MTAVVAASQVCPPGGMTGSLMVVKSELCRSMMRMRSGIERRREGSRWMKKVGRELRDSYAGHR